MRLASAQECHADTDHTADDGVLQARPQGPLFETSVLPLDMQVEIVDILHWYV